MAITEIGLMVLAYNLTHGPQAKDLEQYQALGQQERAAVDQLIEQNAPLPKEIEDLLKRNRDGALSARGNAPTYESF